MRSILLVLLLIITVAASAQKKSRSQAKSQIKKSYYQKGYDHYTKSEFREALYYFKKYIRLDSNRAEVYKWRGNCYLDLNHLDSARHDYEKALKLSPSMAEVYYNLSRVYSEQDMPDKAEQALRKYLKVRPDDALGLYQLSDLVRERQPDSVIYFLEKAHRSDSANSQINATLASEYYSKQQYARAEALAQKGLSDPQHKFELLQLLTYSTFSSGRYRQSIAWTDSLLALDPEAIPFYAMKAKAEILQHTDTNHVTTHGFVSRFKDIHQTTLDTFRNQSTRPGHRYNFHTLFEKFDSNLPMSLDEYFVLYLGCSTSENYAPYAQTLEPINQLMQAERYDSVLLLATALQQKQQISPALYETVALANFRLKNKEAFALALRKYVGLIEAILATGTGRKADDAFIVTSPSDEYILLGYLGLSSQKQSLVHQDSHSYDVQAARQDDATVTDLYFNIDIPFASLRKMLEEPKDKKDRKKKRKKQRS